MNLSPFEQGGAGGGGTAGGLEVKSYFKYHFLFIMAPSKRRSMAMCGCGVWGAAAALSNI